MNGLELDRKLIEDSCATQRRVLATAIRVQAECRANDNAALTREVDELLLQHAAMVGLVDQLTAALRTSHEKLRKQQDEISTQKGYAFAMENRNNQHGILSSISKGHQMPTEPDAEAASTVDSANVSTVD